MRIGVVGCGNISGIYLKNLRSWPETQVVAVADLDRSRAETKAIEYGVARTLAPEQLLADPEVELVLNLTVPAAHAEIALAAIENGKHVYNEKPLATKLELGCRILEAADARGVRVGCAPDTFLGAGIQTCKALIEQGEIGEVVGAQAFMLGGGQENWHPDPDFFYQPGGGPMLDMGPYYLTALIELLGPIREVLSMTRATHSTRRITSEPKSGQVITVRVPTHQSALLRFQRGPIAQLTTSFDTPVSDLPAIEIHGTSGALRVPDPNGFGGPVWLKRPADRSWMEAPLVSDHVRNLRGIGVKDMAEAITAGRPHRADGRRALEVLQTMLEIHEA